MALFSCQLTNTLTDPYSQTLLESPALHFRNGVIFQILLKYSVCSSHTYQSLVIWLNWHKNLGKCQDAHLRKVVCSFSTLKKYHYSLHAAKEQCRPWFSCLQRQGNYIQWAVPCSILLLKNILWSNFKVFIEVCLLEMFFSFSGFSSNTP